MTDSQNLFRPEDLKQWSAEESLGAPGSYPYTRGIYADMYRSRKWTMRQYAGFGNAYETNKRFRYLLSNGQTGLSTAFDLPTQMGLDSDDPMCHGEVGKTGVAIDSLKDMEKLFAEIDLGKVSTSMTINSTSAILLAMYRAVGTKQGVDPKLLQGTIQNDILKEYEARNTYIFPPTSSMRLITDIFEFCSTEMPKWNTISISGYHIREAGATAVQELAFTFANAIEYVDCAVARGLDVDTIAPQLSFFFVAQMDIFEEVAKFRAARRLWASLMKDRFGAKNPKSMMLRFHVQTAGSSLTQQQPDNNIIRTTLEAMAAVLGGAQSLHTNSKDEALSLPSEASALTALRTQQIIAGETGIGDVVDPFGGSYYVESLTDKIELEAREYLLKIEKLGGAIKAVENGYIQKEIQDAAYKYHQEVESKERIVVGVNKFIDATGEKMDVLRVDPELEVQQKRELKELRASRDQAAVDNALADLLKASKGAENMMPYICKAVEVYATVGEISNTLRTSFGKFRPIAHTLRSESQECPRRGSQSLSSTGKLPDCSRSVSDSLKQDPQHDGFEIWIVDNNSGDGSVEMLARDYPYVKTLANNFNAGFSKGCNQVIPLCTAPYILLLNPDTKVQDNAVSQLADFLDTHPGCGAVGPKVLNYDGTLQLACRRAFPDPAAAFYRVTYLSRLFPNNPTFSRYNYSFADPDKELEVDALSGSAMMVRNDVVKKIGLLDEDIFMFGEDIDWCWRIKQAKCSVNYYPSAVVYHIHGAASRFRPIGTTIDLHKGMHVFYKNT